MTNTPTEPKITITAVITRADGTVEDLGVVSTVTPPAGLINRIIETLKDKTHGS